MSHLLVLALFITFLLKRKGQSALAVLLLYVLLLPELQPLLLEELRFNIRFWVVGAVAAVGVLTGQTARVLQREKWIWLLVLCVLWFCAVGLLAEDVLEGLLRAMSFVALLIVCTSIRGNEAFWEFMTGVFATAGLVVFLSAIAYVSGDPDSLHKTGRVQGLLTNPNDLGTLLWVFLSLSIAIFPRIFRRSRLAITFLFFLGALLLYLTASRAAIGALLAALGTLSFSGNNHKGVLVLCVLLLIGVLLVSNTDAEQQLAAYFRLDTAVSLDDATSGRVREHETAMMLTAEHPLKGIGLGNFPTGPDDPSKHRAVNQLGFELIMVETGIPGLLLICSACLAALWKGQGTLISGKGSRSATRLKMALLVGYLVNCTAEGYLASAAIYPTLLGWLCLVHLLSDERTRIVELVAGTLRFRDQTLLRGHTA
jgi:hypothetical protein